MLTPAKRTYMNAYQKAKRHRDHLILQAVDAMLLDPTETQAMLAYIRTLKAQPLLQRTLSDSPRNVKRRERYQAAKREAREPT